MTAGTIATSAPAPGAEGSESYRLRVLLAGIVGRTWLWFVGGCLLVTLLPMLLGWRPFVIKSGSMEPRIHVGDVVLAAPDHEISDLLGRVVVFADPAQPDLTKAHRVVAVNPDGTLQTQGDANPTPDSATVPLDDVRGLGRLLVASAGLPLVWLQTGQWLWLLAFLASLALAAWAVARDVEDEDDDVEDADQGDDPDDRAGPPGAHLLPLPEAGPRHSSGLQAASTPLLRLSRRGHGRRSPAVTRGWRWRVGAVGALVAALAVPTASAAFSATTTSPSSRWSSGAWAYRNAVVALGPWLYWNLDETSGTTAADSSGNGRSATYTTGGLTDASGFTRGVVAGLPANSPDTGVTLDGTTACLATASSTATVAPVSLTEVVWFRTTSTAGGKLLGFESPQVGVATGPGGSYDRHLYMDGAGTVWFGVSNGGPVTISSPSALNDGAWHMAAASLGAGGMRLYIDGAQVGTSANAAGATTTGWFRAGCGNLAGWGASWSGANNPTTSTNPTQDRPFAGSLDEISIWQSVLTPAQISSLWAAR